MSRLGLLLSCLGVLPLTACLNLSSGGGSGGRGGSGGANGEAGNGGMGAGGANLCADGSCTWGQRFGDTAAQAVNDVKLTDDGQVFVAGRYNGTLSLGANIAVSDTVNTNDPSYLGAQPYLAKFDAKGKPLWIKQPKGLENNEGGAVDIAIQGDLVAFTGSALMPSQSDMFVQIQTIDGDPQAAISVILGGSTSANSSAGVVISKDGATVYVAGTVNGNENTVKPCANVAPFNTNGQDNLFIAAIDAKTGNCKWGTVHGGGHHIGGSMSLALGIDGNPVVSATYMNGTVNNANIPAGPGLFVVKISQVDGTIIGGRGIQSVSPLGMAVDPVSGRIFVTGGQTANLTFAGKVFTFPMGIEALFTVLAFEPDLAESWARIFPGDKTHYGTDIAVDNAGRIFVTGLSVGSFTVDDGKPLVCPSPEMCAALLKLSTNDGAPIAGVAQIFGMGQPIAAGPAPMVAVNAGSLLIGTTWAGSITLLDGNLLPPIGAGMDLDIVLSKVTPAP